MTSPWVLARDEANKLRLGTVLYNLAECLRFAAVMLQSCFTNTPALIFQQLGLVQGMLTTWDSLKAFGALPSGSTVVTLPVLFPRLDVNVELGVLELMNPQVKIKVPEEKDSSRPMKPEITIDDFAKVDLRLAKVIAAEAVEKSDKLLKLTLDVGALGIRTVASGIAKQYKPAEMVGKNVVLVCNLKPAKLRGMLSEGMILAASDDEGNLKVVEVDGLPEGSEVR